MAAVDEFDLETFNDDGGAPSARSPRRRPGQPWPWILAAAAAVALGAANADPLPVAIGLGEGLDVRLLDADLAHPPKTLWTSEGTPSAVIVIEDDRAVLSMDETDGRHSLVGIDLATGDEAWRYLDPGMSCSWGTALMCVESPGTASALLVDIDLSDGSRETTPYPHALAAITIGPDVAVIEATDTIEESVVLLESDGSERWRIRADAADVETAGYWSLLWLDGDRLALEYSATVVDLTTGATSSRVAWNFTQDTTVEYTESGHIVRTAAETVQLLPGEFLIPFDDDLGGPVVLVADERTGDLIARWRSTGEELWLRSIVDGSCEPWVRQQGLLTMLCWGSTAQLITVNLLSGAELWAGEPLYPITAGNGVMVVLDFTSGDLSGVDIRTGETLWTAPSLGPLSLIEPLPDGLLLGTGTTLTRLQWD